MSNTESAWREGRVLREKVGLTGDVLALTVAHIPPGHDHARSRFSVTRRPGGTIGAEIVLLSEDFYAIAQFDAAGELEFIFDAVREKFETAFGYEAARMDADDAAYAIDLVLSESNGPHDANTKA